MLTCRELTEFLDDYIAGTLPRRVALSFRFHLALCRDCKRYLRSYRQTVKLARASLGGPDSGAPAGVPEALVQAILASRRAGADDRAPPI